MSILYTLSFSWSFCSKFNLVETLEPPGPDKLIPIPNENKVKEKSTDIFLQEKLYPLQSEDYLSLYYGDITMESGNKWQFHVEMYSCLATDIEVGLGEEYCQRNNPTNWHTWKWRIKEAMIKWHHCLFYTSVG